MNYDNNWRTHIRLVLICFNNFCHETQSFLFKKYLLDGIYDFRNKKITAIIIVTITAMGGQLL